MRPKGVPLAVSGRARVRIADLRQKLGDAAWWTLQALWRLRDVRGETHVTNRGLATGAAGFAPLAFRVVRKACARLKSAGLLFCLGRQPRDVKRGRATVSLRVIVRRVLGAPAEGDLGAKEMVFVPGRTTTWLESASSWGGVRSGSGGYRHGARRSQQEGPVCQQEGPISGLGEVSKRGRRSISGKYPLGVPANLLASLGDAALRVEDDEGAVLGFGSIPDGASSDASVVERNGASGGLSGPTPPEGTPEPSAGPLGASLREGGGSRPKAPVMPTSPLPGTPPAPWVLIGVAKTPNPPILDPDMREREMVLALVSAYRSAATNRFGKLPKFAFGRGDVTKSRHYPMLAAAARFMLGHELAPAAWCAWSCDIWRTYNTESKPPPVAWVYGEKRLAERRGWFEREEGGYLGGRVVCGPRQNALLRRYMTMRHAVDAEEAWYAPGGVFDRFFPGDTYERAVEAAKAEVVASTAKLREQVDGGAFLW